MYLKFCHLKLIIYGLGLYRVENSRAGSTKKEGVGKEIATETGKDAAVRAALDGLEGAGVERNTATLGLISLLCDELLERRASA